MSLVTRIKGKKSEKNRRQIKKGSEVERKASKKGPVKCSCKCVASMFVNRPLLTHTKVQMAYILTFLYVYMLVLQGWFIVLTFMFPCTLVLQFEQLKLVR